MSRHDTTRPDQPASTDSGPLLVEALQRPHAYPDPGDQPVVVHETHISWIFLVGQYAYKVKKAIRTDFLDYSTLAKRQHHCQEELRLDRRYAEPLYLAVVPITEQDGRITVEGEGEPIEFAVKMRRFPADALLTQQVREDAVTRDDLRQLARTVARFHATAARSGEHDTYGRFESVREDAEANFRALMTADVASRHETLKSLHRWSETFLESHRHRFERRRSDGFIRECHGDLHLANVIRWQDQWMPFDGIEFNAALRWIDVLNDAAFLAMDLAAEDHSEFAHSFITAYLEYTGDYGSLHLLRFYLVYRAMVRAKIAMIRRSQSDTASQQAAAMEDCHRHIELADRFTSPPELSLTITHGYSGSGKTTGSEAAVQRRGAIRLRSDVERKRLYGIDLEQRPAASDVPELYSHAATEATYLKLQELSAQVLQAGYPVIVDATFLRQRHREAFAAFARSQDIPFRILDFPVDPAVLRKRVAERQRRGGDASDAGLDVLEKQLHSAEPLTESERQIASEMPVDDNR